VNAEKVPVSQSIVEEINGLERIYWVIGDRIQPMKLSGNFYPVLDTQKAAEIWRAKAESKFGVTFAGGVQPISRHDATRHAFLCGQPCVRVFDENGNEVESWPVWGAE